MPKKLDTCVEKLLKEGKKESSAFAICNAAMKDSVSVFSASFTDEVIYDAATRTVISVRDGVQKYYGSEFGMEPLDKVFTIYRGPETIKAAAGEMSGLPMTDEHVPLDQVPTTVIGKVINARVIDSVDPTTNTTVKVQNEVQLDNEIAKRGLSLGYHADLVPCDLYDFEQVDMVPHHLAVVEKGRCGETCTFADEANMKKKLKLNALFLDAEGEINMQQVLQLVADLPEVVKTLPLKELQKLAKLLTKAMDVATAEIAVEASGEGELEAEAVEQTTEAPIETSVEVEDEKEEDMKKDVATSDSDFVNFLDTKEFLDAVAMESKKINAEYAIVVSKAKDFLPSTYDFSDKCACDIMAAALATQHTEKFEDSELSTAFKLLKKNTSYENFGKEKVDFVDELKDKEL